MEHAYDFYKPNLSSEFPVVDGKLSIQCYLTALDKCYQRYSERAGGGGANFSLSGADYLVFHSPFTKLVQKSLGRLKFIDFLWASSPDTAEGATYAGMESLKLAPLPPSLHLSEILTSCASMMPGAGLSGTPSGIRRSSVCW